MLALTDYFVQLYAYNSWANQLFMDAAGGLTEEQLHHQHGHSFGSVHGLLVHVMGAEWIWLNRWQGVSPTALLDPKVFPTLKELREAWEEQDHRLRLLIGAQTVESLQQAVDYTNTKGKPFALPLWQLLGHVANHGTHHRGELAAMFAMMEAPHPEEDWYFFFQTFS